MQVIGSSCQAQGHVNPGDSVLLGNVSLLRALLSAVREAFEEVPEATFSERIGVSVAAATAWECQLRDAYRALKDAEFTAGRAEATLGREIGAVWPVSAEPPPGCIVMVVGDRELHAYLAMLQVTLDEIEVWEYRTRMGFDPAEVRSLIDRLARES